MDFQQLLLWFPFINIWSFFAYFNAKKESKCNQHKGLDSAKDTRLLPHNLSKSFSILNKVPIMHHTQIIKCAQGSLWIAYAPLKFFIFVMNHLEASALTLAKPGDSMLLFVENSWLCSLKEILKTIAVTFTREAGI